MKGNPNELEILGNGNQKKSYPYVEDCVDGMIFASRKVKSNLEIFNLGSEDWISVKEIAEIVCKELNLTPKLKFGESDKGWKGDVPLMLLDISKIKKLGWRPRYNSRDSVLLTLNLLKNYLA